MKLVWNSFVVIVIAIWRLMKARELSAKYLEELVVVLKEQYNKKDEVH
ncbi:MAG TPA: hypothetical protein VFC73_00105 [Syntrophomonadaceae bacterium]|nr:hypothetical protein [Syntrophomonadaceae bacterium]